MNQKKPQYIAKSPLAKGQSSLLPPSPALDIGKTTTLLTNSPVPSFYEPGLVHSLASISVHQWFPKLFHPKTAKTHPVMPNRSVFRPSLLSRRAWRSQLKYHATPD